MIKDSSIKSEIEAEGFYLIPKSVLKSILESNRKILSLLQSGGNNSINSIGDYISEAEAKKLLNKKTTWFWNMRTTGKLAFSKVGGTIFYHKADIVKLIEDGKVV